MALVDGSAPNLVGGVSQQPDALRFETQIDEGINCYPSPVDGLHKRQPTQHIAKLYTISGTPSGNPEPVALDRVFSPPAPTRTGDKSLATHWINRDATERYTVVLSSGSLRVFALADGSEKTVSTPDGVGYITQSNPRDNFTFLTVADYTFVVNKQKVVAKTADTVPTRTREALVNIKAGNYGKTYTVVLNGTIYASYKAPDGGAATDAPKIDTLYICNQLKLHLNGSNNDNGAPPNTLGAGWTITQHQNALHIVKNDNADFQIQVTDGYNGNAAVAIKDTVQKFGDLPNYGPDGFVVEVVGDPGNAFDNYWVKIEKSQNNDNNAAIVWRETAKPGITYKLDATTMPHILVRNGDGTFTFKKATWNDRLVGDGDKRGSDPSFIGGTIEDIFFFRNRLGVLSGENVILSRAGDFFNYFQTSITTLLDNDPIDVGSSDVKVSKLWAAVPFSGKLVVFADQTQFELSGGDLLTPKTAKMLPTTRYQALRSCRPDSAGSSVFFAVDANQWSGIREYIVLDASTNTDDAIDTTAQAPRYVAGSPFKLAASTTDNVVAVLSDTAQSYVFMYKWLWSENQKAQSSWVKWYLGPEAIVLDITFIGTDMWFLVNRTGGLYIEKATLAAGVVDDGVKYRTLLDRRADNTACSGFSYDAVTDRTTFTAPYAPRSTAQVVTRYDSGNLGTDGQQLEVYSVSGTTVVVNGNHTATKFYIGEPYTMRVRLSKPYVRDGKGAPVVTGRLQVLRYLLNYDRTGYFKVEVTVEGRATSTRIFAGRVIRRPNQTLNSVPIVSGTFKFAVMAKNDTFDVEIVSDSWLPSHLLNLEWEGDYTPFASRTR